MGTRTIIDKRGLSGAHVRDDASSFDVYVGTTSIYGDLYVYGLTNLSGTIIRGDLTALGTVSGSFPGSGGGSTGSVGTTNFLQRVAIVDPINGSDVSGTFGTTRAYKTISAATTAIPMATDSESARRTWVVLISPGTYDEDLTIDGTRRRIALMGVGSWGLGTFSGSNWAASGTPRNLTWSVSLTNIDSIRSTIVVGSIMGPSNASSTHQAYNTSPRISGRIILNDDVLGGATKEAYIQAKVFDLGATGTSLLYTGSSSTPGQMNVYLTKSAFATQVSGSGMRLQLADQTTFSGLINVNNYSRIQDCTIAAGMTIAVDTADQQPSGMINTNFAGTFTGPASSLRLDGNTNYWFRTNGATLTGSATKVIQEDAGFLQSFTNVSLVSGALTGSHNLNKKYVMTQVYDNNDRTIIPDQVTALGTGSIAIDLSSFGAISGTWNLVVY